MRRETISYTDEDGELVVLRVRGRFTQERVNGSKLFLRIDLGNSLEVSIGHRCSISGAREFSFGKVGAERHDTSFPVGRNPLKTLRAVKNFLLSSSCSFWSEGGDSRLSKFYAKLGLGSDCFHIDKTKLTNH